MGENRARENSIVEAITAAVIELWKTTNPDDISIKEVIAEAGVSRSSFYRYFDSIRDVISKAEDRYLAEILESNQMSKMSMRVSKDGAIWDSLVPQIMTVKKQRDFIIAVNGPFGDLDYQCRMREAYRAHYEEVFATQGLSEEEAELVVSYLYAGHREFLITWLTQFPDMPLEQVVRLNYLMLNAPLNALAAKK